MATNLQEASTLGYVARNIPRINDAMEDRQVYFQPTMIELEGKIQIQSVSILVDLVANLSYIHPCIVKNCKLENQKFKNPWLVQLATGEKRRVNSKVSNCELVIGDQHIIVELNILPLGSYNILFGMD